jgi:osmotically-inducible protein OsmY
MKRLNPVTMTIVAVIILGVGMAFLSTKGADRKIKSAAENTHVFRSYLLKDNVKISKVKNGNVTLTGTVSEWPHRHLAEETVGNLPGVKSVNNKIEVTGGQPSEKSDPWIHMKVGATLMFHRNVNIVKTDIEVKDGVVTITGIASTEAQKELTTEYVMDIDGVKSVKNDMVVEIAKETVVEKVSESIDDASITAQVKLALLFHRSTSAIKTKVETRDGTVTVSGTAKDNTEKDLVGELVTNIKGVKSLKNEITIGG